ncbi:MAG: hypothetical protein ORN28_11075 [Rhodoferax sp.]|nr:hypothetical protein [Rhodoferax sp.]
MNPQRYWAILANFITFNLIPFAVVPYWLLFTQWAIWRRELLFMLLLALLSLRVLMFDHSPFEIHMVSYLAEYLILLVFFWTGYSLFKNASQTRLLQMAAFVLVFTCLDFYVLNLSLTRFVAHSAPARDVLVSGRGPYMAAPEASYWVLTLLGFFNYSAGRQWWKSAFAFAALMVWNGGIYALSLLLVCCLFLLPWRARIIGLLLATVGLLVAFWFNMISSRLMALAVNLSINKYQAPNLLNTFVMIEEDFGSRRYSAVLHSLQNAHSTSYIDLEPYSLLSQMAVHFGWLIALPAWGLLLGLTMYRYVMPLNQKLLLIVLSVIAGPVSIPFLYSFIFTSPQRKALLS